MKFKEELEYRLIQYKSGKISLFDAKRKIDELSKSYSNFNTFSFFLGGLYCWLVLLFIQSLIK